MPEKIHSAADEHPLLKLNPVGSGYSSAPAAIFSLRRNDYFNSTRFAGAERRLSRTIIIANERRRSPLYGRHGSMER